MAEYFAGGNRRFVDGEWRDDDGRCYRMICRECGAKMYLDDRDYDFKGKYDNYWNCPDCQTGCIEEIRFSKPFRELWHSENNEVKDEIIKRQ